MNTNRFLRPAAMVVLLLAGALVGPALAGPPPATGPAGSPKASAATPVAPVPAGREDIYRDMEGMFGSVPSFFKLVPDRSLALEWQLFKTVQFEPGPIPNKYRELIGLGISSITHCTYCIAYHTEIARLNGASEAELEDAVHYAKSTAGWSTYLNGMQVDLGQFKSEVRAAAAYARAQSEKGKAK